MQEHGILMLVDLWSKAERKDEHEIVVQRYERADYRACKKRERKRRRRSQK